MRYKIIIIILHYLLMESRNTKQRMYNVMLLLFIIFHSLGKNYCSELEYQFVQTSACVHFGIYDGIIAIHSIKI